MYVQYNIHSLKMKYFVYTIVKSSCAIDNGGCSDLCLLAAGGNHTCACPTGIVLLDDGKNCEDGKQYIVLYCIHSLYYIFVL
jgi:hypothetical protein